MKKIYILGLMLLISFGSIGAVAFTPALPQIANYFDIPNSIAELCVTLYLIGYCLGQLIYGPLTNRFGSQLTIIIGAVIEITGTGLCIAAKSFNSFELLLIGRAVMAIGAGSGLTLAFIISSKLSTTDKNAQTISLLTIAFAITPGIGVFIGGLLLNSFNWSSSFYFMAVYGLLILIVGLLLPEVITQRQMQALNPGTIVRNYLTQIRSAPLIWGGLLVGSGTCIVYTFAALAPFIALNKMQMNTTQYGSYNFIPVTGMLCGSLLASYLGKKYLPAHLLKIGLSISSIGIIILLCSLIMTPANYLSLFAPMFIIYLGFTFVFGNSSALALSKSSDKSNASAMMSFINMGSAVVVTTLLTFINNTSILLLPTLYIVFILGGITCFNYLLKYLNQT